MVHRQRAFFLLVVASMACTCSSRTQESQRASDYAIEPADPLLRRNNASILFDRNANTFNWIGRAALDTSAGGVYIRLNEQFISNIILVEGAAPVKRLRSDQQRLSLFLARPVTDEFSVQGKWASLIYTDNKAVGLSSASMNSVLAGVGYAPWQALSLTPMAGYHWENQLGIRDRGMSYFLGAELSEIDLGGYRFVGSGQFLEDRIDPRLLDRHFARINIQKSFIGNTRDSLELGISRNRREFYSTGENTIESRVENIFSFSNLLDYEFTRNFLTTLYVSVIERALDKDIRSFREETPGLAPLNTGIDEFRLESYLQTVYLNDDGRTMGSVRLYHSERTEQHFAKVVQSGADKEQIKDNAARRTALMGMAHIPVSPSDTISLSSSASILRYDTPSTENFEDRDELFVAFSLTTSHRINQYLSLSLALDANLNHLVYLFSQSSGNNNFNRILRLSPRTLYRPFTGFVTMNQFEVLANYTSYDFETGAGRVRSFSYRQFGWIDSTAIELTARIGLDFFLYLKLYERGQFNWREFSERRENSFLDQTYAAQVRFSPWAGTVFAAGLRYFSQLRYKYDGEEKNIKSFLRSIGPTCLIVWETAPTSQVGLKGWYERRRLPDGSSRSLANMTLNMQFNF